MNNKDKRNLIISGQRHIIEDFSITEIIPPSSFYITYEGSLTQPSCQETVTWIIINKPLRITDHQVIAGFSYLYIIKILFIRLCAGSYRDIIHFQILYNPISI